MSKTPEPTVPPRPGDRAPSLAPPPVAAPTATAAADPCAVNLAAPEIIKAVSELPRDPRSNQAWNPEPLAGNYNECAQLSAVIVKANTNSDNPNTRAVLFHLGKFIPTGVPDTYGFNGIDDSATTGDTIALRYSGGIEGLDSVVKFRWNGNGVELIGNTADFRLLRAERGLPARLSVVKCASSPHSAARGRATKFARRVGSPPTAPTRRPHRIPHASQEDMRPVAQVISTHPDDHPALAASLARRSMSRAVVRVVPMLRTVVFDSIFHSSQPMSTRPTNSPYSSTTRPAFAVSKPSGDQ